MELACEILKKRTDNNNTTKSLKKFKNLKLQNGLKTSNKEDFLKKIKSPQYKKIANNFAKKCFYSKNKDLGQAIMMAYYFSYYGNDVFGEFKTYYEKKLINAAHEVVCYLERKNNNYNDNFYDILDNYYSLYQTFIKKSSLYKIDDMMVILEDYIKASKLLQIQNKSIDHNFIKKINNIISEIFKINHNFAIKTFLQNYDMFIDSNNIMKHIWDKIKEYFKNDIRHAILIIIAELRVKLIQSLTLSEDKKDIYFNIDIEIIIKDIRNNDFTIEKINNIIKLLLQKINKITNLNITNQKLDNQKLFEIFDLFQIIFNTIYHS